MNERSASYYSRGPATAARPRPLLALLLALAACSPTESGPAAGPPDLGTAQPDLGAPPSPPELCPAPCERFTLAVLPDTQHYAESDEGAAIWRSQIDWLLAQRTERNIVFTTHLGDLVGHAEEELEWQRARAAMDPFDLAEPRMPWAVALGNHDIGPSAFAEQYFGPRRADGSAAPPPADEPWWGGDYLHPDHLGGRDSNQRFLLGGQPYLVLHISYVGWAFEALGPDPPLGDRADDSPAALAAKAHLRWARQVLLDHPDHRAIVVAHAFLSDIDGQPAHAIRSGVVEPISTAPLWDHVIAPSPNVFLVLNGHERGLQAEIHRTGEVDGRTVHQILSNYQTRDEGGARWLRLMEVDLAEGVLRVQTYSPSLDAWEEDESSAFELGL